MRIVIKVGSSTLTHKTGKIDLKIIEKLVRVISDLKNQGHELVLVSSGAQAVGLTKLKLKSRPSNTRQRQAIASVGQSELMSIYDRMFNDYGYNVGQILLTKDAMDIAARKKHVVDTFNALLEYDCIPVVNENDSVEVDEIKFGDNDTLSAIVSVGINADILIILSDIHYLYDSDPTTNPKAIPIHVVEKITDAIRVLAGKPTSKVGTGGMVTKIKAAEKVTKNGIDMYIAYGKNPEVLYDILDGKDVGTIFKAHQSAK